VDLRTGRWALWFLNSPRNCAPGFVEPGGTTRCQAFHHVSRVGMIPHVAAERWLGGNSPTVDSLRFPNWTVDTATWLPYTTGHGGWTRRATTTGYPPATYPHKCGPPPLVGGLPHPAFTRFHYATPRTTPPLLDATLAGRFTGCRSWTPHCIEVRNRFQPTTVIHAGRTYRGFTAHPPEPGWVLDPLQDNDGLTRRISAYPFRPL